MCVCMYTQYMSPQIFVLQTRHFKSENVSYICRFAEKEEDSLATENVCRKKKEEKRAQSNMRKAIAICSRKGECEREEFFHEKIRLLFCDTVKSKYVYICWRRRTSHDKNEI